MESVCTTSFSREKVETLIPTSPPPLADGGIGSCDPKKRCGDPKGPTSPICAFAKKSLGKRLHSLHSLHQTRKKRLGELLAATDRAKGVRLAGRSIGGNVVIPPKDDAPTLSELGVRKRESAEAIGAT